MFYRKINLVVLAIIFVVLLSVPVSAQDWNTVHGEITRVFPEQRKVLLESKGEKLILVLSDDCKIVRSGKPTGLRSLRPISCEDFQDGIFGIDANGKVKFVLVNYNVTEENGVLVKRDIFGNVL